MSLANEMQMFWRRAWRHGRRSKRGDGDGKGAGRGRWPGGTERLPRATSEPLNLHLQSASTAAPALTHLRRRKAERIPASIGAPRRIISEEDHLRRGHLHASQPLNCPASDAIAAPQLYPPESLSKLDVRRIFPESPCRMTRGCMWGNWRSEARRSTYSHKQWRFQRKRLISQPLLFNIFKNFFLVIYEAYGLVYLRWSTSVIKRHRLSRLHPFSSKKPKKN